MEVPPTAPPRARGYRQSLPHRACRETVPGTVGLWVLHRGRFTGRTWCSRPPGSWWALLTARTGALYEQCNHMGAQAPAFGSGKRCVAASLFLRSPGSREHGLPGPAVVAAPRWLARRTGVTAHLDRIIRPGLGAASAASSVKRRLGWEKSAEKENPHPPRRRVGASPAPRSHPGRSGRSV